jgi:cytochrome c553
MKAPVRPTWLLALMVLLCACEKAADDVREWTPADHDNAPAPGAAEPKRPPGEPGPAQPPSDGHDSLAAMQSWGRLCVRCHGRFGRGDGPDGKPLAMPDFGSEQWQSQVTDARMVQVIQAGRGAMPAFSLPEQQVAGLVQLVRQMRTGTANAPPTPSGSSVAGPTPSASGSQ